MDSLGTIVKSWILYAQGNSFTKHLIEKRTGICIGCPFHSTQLGFLQCTKCGCPLAARTANPDLECPIKLWKKVDDESFF